jgi:hypothetical protein
MSSKTNLMKAADHLEDAARLSRRLIRITNRLAENRNERMALMAESVALEEQYQAFLSLNKEYWNLAHEASGLSRDALQILALDISEAPSGPHTTLKDTEKVVDDFIAQLASVGAKEE